MSFIYPRTITIKRPAVTTGVGTVAYQGLDPTTETTVVTGVAASIQQSQNTRKPQSDLPSDVARGTLWNIFFKLDNGTVKDRDIVIDDEGIRYQVMAAYWNSLGYRAICERLEA